MAIHAGTDIATALGAWWSVLLKVRTVLPRITAAVFVNDHENGPHQHHTVRLVEVPPRAAEDSVITGHLDGFA